MREVSNIAGPLPPLPPELADGLEDGPSVGEGKRGRTRLQLLRAAMQVFASRGVALATLQEVAAVAGVANGTVYNHFRTKEDLLRGVAYWLADTLCHRINDSYPHVEDARERMAIGNRRYFWLAEQSPEWALLLLELGTAAPEEFAAIREYPLQDLRLGVRQKVFKVVSEAAAMDMVLGTVLQAMRTIATGLAPAQHATAMAATVLRGLGVPPVEAAAIARRPLPPLRPPVAR